MSWSDLRVELDPPYSRANYKAHIFGPGYRIAGKMVFSTKKDEKIDSIIIQFKGKCINRHGEGLEERRQEMYELDMFALQETLFQGPFKLKAGSHDYPFSFVFPETYEYRFDDTRDPKEPFVVFTGPAPLPPACHDEFEIVSSFSVSYLMIAKIPRKLKDMEDKILFEFQSLPDPAQPATT